MRINSRFSAVLMVAVLLVAALGLTGCGTADITGEWQIEGSPRTVVIDETRFSMMGGGFEYEISKDKKSITLGVGQEGSTTVPFELAEDGQSFTITETDAASGSSLVTKLVKLSDNKDATPTIIGMEDVDMSGSGTDDSGTETETENPETEGTEKD